MDLSAGASNGYPQQHSPNPVGGGAGGAVKVPSPPGPPINSRPSLRVVIPNSRGDGVSMLLQYAWNLIFLSIGVLKLIIV
jgi:hypothetical protein